MDDAVAKLKAEKAELEERLQSMAQVVEMLSQEPAAEEDHGKVKGYLDDVQKRLKQVERRIKDPTVPPAIADKMKQADRVPGLEKKVSELEEKLSAREMPAALFGDVEKLGAEAREPREKAPEARLQSPVPPPLPVGGSDAALLLEVLRLLAALEQRVSALEQR